MEWTLKILLLSVPTQAQSPVKVCVGLFTLPPTNYISLVEKKEEMDSHHERKIHEKQQKQQQ